MKYLNRISIAVAVVAVVFAALLWQRNNTQTASKTPALTTVKLALDWTPNTNHTGIYVAQAKGWYKEQGIDLQILPYSSTVYANTLISNGKSDIGIMTTEDVISEAAKNHPLVEIGALLQHNPSGLIVREDSGIKSPKELDGKSYGGFGSPIADAVVKTVIQKDGGQGDFKNVVLNIQAMQALTTKKIDFVWVFAGWELIQARRDGMKASFFPIISYGVPDAPTLAFTTTKDKVNNNGDMLKKFMTATAKGYEHARQNPKEDAQILIDKAPKGTFPDTGLVFDSQNYVSPLYTNENGKWGIQDSKAWSSYAQFILGTGTVSDASDKPVKTMDFSGLYTNKFLQ
jgi:ABC-type nitrate/sulfonate/bicarbonate transport system substrate-binding protein